MTTTPPEPRTLPSTARHALQSFGADWPEWARVAVNDVIDQALASPSIDIETLAPWIASMKMAAVYPDGRPAPNGYEGGWNDALDEVLARLRNESEPGQPLHLDIETLARALEAADGVQGFGGAGMAMRWAERIAAEYTRLADPKGATE